MYSKQNPLCPQSCTLLDLFGHICRPANQKHNNMFKKCCCDQEQEMKQIVCRDSRLMLDYFIFAERNFASYKLINYCVYSHTCMMYLISA